MKISISWLKELVELKVSIEELVRLLPLRTIGTKEITGDFIELDMKGYNRADLLSLRGVAREISAITDSKITFEEENPKDFPWVKNKLPETPVIVKNPELAPVYCIVKIEGLKVEPSKPEWVKKLADSGIRSVNNVVDVTNLLMVEYGQDMHSFDADKIKDQTLIVRLAQEGEQLTTLDGKKLTLSPEDLIIADSQKPVGLAGIMGGKDSEVSDQTHTILLEITIFDPITIRKTSQRYGLYSEAAKRVQHGLTKTNLLQSMSAAIEMYKGLGGKLTAITLKGNLNDEIKTIKLSREKVNSLIGVDISPKDIESSLKKLGFLWNNWEVTVPYWRLDINIEEDLIEEVARMYGYERIKPKELIGELPEKIDQSFFERIYKLKTDLANAGLTQVQTYSFYSTTVIENCKLKIENLIKILNPMSAETEYMKDMLWPNLLEAVAKNLRQGYKDIAIFEIGKVYLPRLASGKAGLPEETYRLSIALCNGTDNPIAELNQIVKNLNLHPKGGKLNLSEYFHPTRRVDGLAEVHPRIVNKFGIEQRVAVLEIDITPL